MASVDWNVIAAQVSWAQQTYYKEPAHRSKRCDALWRATRAILEPEYVYVGVSEGMLPELTVVLQGSLWVAVARIATLKRSYRATHGEKAPEPDIVELCGYMTGTSAKDLQKSLPNEEPWICWRVLKAGQMLQTPPGCVRAEGKGGFEVRSFWILDYQAGQTMGI